MFRPYEHTHLRLRVPYAGPSGGVALKRTSPVFSEAAARSLQESAPEPGDVLPAGGLRIQVYPLDD